MATGANDLTTVAKLKTFLRSTVTTDDTLLQQIITGVSTEIEGVCGRHLVSASYTEHRTGNGKTVMLANEYPITTLTQILVAGVDIPTASDPTTTVAEIYGKRISDDGLSFELTGGYCFYNGYTAVIKYTAGYSTIPLDLELACLRWCASWYSQLDRIDQESKSIGVGGQTISFFTGEIPKIAAMALRKYTRVAPRGN
jgi:hypothetical protein